jgi:glycosyltransferase involved in cell wall biosynthesis
MELSKLAKFYAKHPNIHRQHAQKYLQLTSQKKAPYSLISIEPLILYMAFSLSEEFKLASLEPIFNYLQDRTVYFFKNWWWDMENPHEVAKVKEIEDRHIRQYPKHQFIHLCNTLQQQQIFEEYNLNAIFCNQNCLIDERIFKPITGISKKIDAVYDARFSTYKRHYLAQRLDSIALIGTCSPSDYQGVKSLLPQAHYFNQALAEGGPSLLLPAETVNQCLNTCKVGLCLSSVEGAMYASTQYLLSGLPVVSTHSKGGRDVFFDEEYTLIVEDDPDAVKEGVDELVRRNICAKMIRCKVLEKIDRHRLTLINLIQSIYDREGVEKDFSLEWERIFFNKLYKLQKPEEAIKQIELAKVKSRIQ